LPLAAPAAVTVVVFPLPGAVRVTVLAAPAAVVVLKTVVGLKTVLYLVTVPGFGQAARASLIGEANAGEMAQRARADAAMENFILAVDCSVI
jgi:hypothetical protein